MKSISWIALIFLILGFSASCSDPPETLSLRVGLMPAVDSAPFFYAKEQGLFEKQGLQVKLDLFTNAQNRQSALQSGQIDGAMTDLVALIVNRSQGFPIRGTLSTDGSFFLLSYPQATTQPITVGLMEISVTNYLVQKYLEAQSYTPVYINEIPLRLQAVASGQTTKGFFPEPIASIGALQGLVKESYPGIPKESLDLMVFTETALEQKSKALEIFHQVYGAAAAALSANPDLAKAVLLRSIPNLPPTIQNLLAIPEYSDPSLPSVGFTTEVVDWTTELLGKELELDHTSLFDGRFIQQ